MPCHAGGKLARATKDLKKETDLQRSRNFTRLENTPRAFSKNVYRLVARPVMILSGRKDGMLSVRNN